jgi:hypothetical protein
MGGGIRRATSAITASEMTPGPLGISDTRPTAEAPCLTAMRASSALAMQQIFTLGLSGTDARSPSPKHFDSE